jgi:2-phosphoglycerate kinase
MEKVILIGGAPTTGKSTMAQMLSKHLDLPWISTDQIREIMTATVNQESFPHLFSEKGYTPERFYEEFSTEQIADKEMMQGDEVWRGIQALIQKDLTWRTGCIIEGVNILPHLVARDFKDDRRIKTVFLVDDDADRVREVIFSRGLWEEASKYSDEAKEKEIEWVQLFSHKLKTEAQHYEYPCIEVQKHNNDLRRILKALELE